MLKGLVVVLMTPFIVVGLLYAFCLAGFLVGRFALAEWFEENM